MYAVTGATGHLGRLVVAELLKTARPEEVAAVVRDPAKASDLAVKGIVVRHADYNRPETLGPALEGVDKVLLISGNEVGRRGPQHQAVIDAAKAAGAKLVAYTSILHADRSEIGLAEEHRQTEAALKSSGVPWVLLRNSWYTENYTGSIPAALERGVIQGSAGEGRISAATRADYAAAAAAVLASGDDQDGRVYELGGDEAFTMGQFAEELSRQAGRTVVYRSLPPDEYAALLTGAGLPPPVAQMLAGADAAIARDALFDDSRQLSRLIGRPTTPFGEAIGAALAG